MLKIKHFLMALSFIPLSLTALQLPASAQNFVPSKGVAGFNSGQNGGGSGSLNFTSTTGGTTSFTFVITQPDILAGIDGLQTFGLLGSQTATAAKESLNKLFSNSERGTSVVKQNLSGTADGVVSYTDSKGTKDVVYPKAPAGLSQDAVLSIVTLGASVGASDAQIKAAVNIAATGAAPTATYKMLLSVAALFATVKTSSVETDLKVSSVADQSQDTSLKLKSFARDLLIAQSKSVTVDSGALAAAIDSYNDLLSGSTPETVSKLSDNKPFMKVGGALRSMRSAFN